MTYNSSTNPDLGTHGSNRIDASMDGFRTISEQAMKGDVRAMVLLGRAYRDGDGVEQNLTKAAEWFRKAVKINGDEVTNELVSVLWKIKTPESYAEAMQLIQEAAGTGDAAALGRLGKAYLDGKGVDQDLEVAADLCRESLIRGNARIKRDLVTALLLLSTKESLAECADICEETDEQWAKMILAEMYMSGFGTEKDIFRSRKLLNQCDAKCCGFKMAFVVNPQVFESEGVVLCGSQNQIRVLKTIAIQYAVPTEGYVSDCEFSSFYGRRIAADDRKRYSVMCMGSLPEGLPMGDCRIFDCDLENESGLEPFLLLRDGIDKITSSSADSPLMERLQVPDNCNMDVVENLEDISLTSYNIVTNAFNSAGKILYRGGINVRSISLDSLETNYLSGKCIYNHLHDEKKRLLVCTEAPMGDQFRTLIPRQGYDPDSNVIMVNKKARDLPYIFGVPGIVLDDPFYKLFLTFSLMDRPEGMTMTSDRYYPGLNYDKFYFGFDGYAGDCLRLSYNTKSKKKCMKCSLPECGKGVPPRSVLLNPYGNWIRSKVDDVYGKMISVFTDTAVELKKRGYNVYTNVMPGQMEIDGTSRYDATIREFIGDSRNFDYVISTVTGFVEVSLLTDSGIIVINPTSFDFSRFVDDNDHERYWEVKCDNSFNGINDKIVEILDSDDGPVGVPRPKKTMEPKRPDFLPMLLDDMDCYDPHIVKSFCGLFQADRLMPCCDECSSVFSKLIKYHLIVDRKFNHSIDEDVYLLKGRVEDEWTRGLYLNALYKASTPESLEEYVRVSSEYSRRSDPSASLFLGRAYRDGKGVEINLDKASELMRESLSAGNERAIGDFLGVLWRIRTPEAYDELFQTALRYAEKGNSTAMLWCGRAYRDGKGTVQDLARASDCLREASKRMGWAKNELFDVLWKIGTPEAYEEMIGVAESHAATGDGNAIGRLGKAYREGKGVDTDLSKALEYLREASGKGVGWAKNELFDTLWMVGTHEAYEEMIQVAEDFAASGDANAMIRLGRAYRDGKGVDLDLDKAEALFKQASEKSPSAKRELKTIVRP